MRFRNPRTKSKHNAGLHMEAQIDASNLLDTYPVFVPGRTSKGSCRKFSLDARKNSDHLVQVCAASKLSRQNGQAESDSPKVTWLFELAVISTKAAVEPPKKSEMDEAAAATKNRSIRDLGFYWRRAPY